MGMEKSVFASIFVKPILKFFLKSPYQGSLTTVYVALDPSLQNVSGKYFRYLIKNNYCKVQVWLGSLTYPHILESKIEYFNSDCKEVPVASQAEDKEAALRLWLTSEKWTQSTFHNNLAHKEKLTQSFS